MHDDIRIFALSEEEYNNPETKNGIIMEDSNSPKMIFVKEENADLAIRLAKALQAGDEVAILYECDPWVDNSAKELTYEEAFSLQADHIAGIGFGKNLLRICGSFHVGFPRADVLEFLCRLLSRVKAGRLLPLKESSKNKTEDLGNLEGEIIPKDSEANPEEIAFSHAYLIRRHMEQLRKEGLLDEALQKTSELMLRQGCFPLFQQYLNYFLENKEQYEKLAAFTAPFLVLRGDNTCGGVLQQFADDLTNALIDQGQIVYEITGEEDENEGLASFWGKTLKGIIGFQAPVLESSFCRKLSAPKFQFWFDNPFSFQGVLKNLPRDYYVLCQDDDHAEWIREYYHTVNALQLPPGGMDEIFLPKGENSSLNEIKRDKDIVFMGRYFPEDTHELNKLQIGFYEYMIAHPTLNFEQGIRSFLAKKKIDVPKMLFSMKEACRAVIGHYRNQVMETILQAGYFIHVYGSEWEEYQGAGKEKLIIHTEVSMQESVNEFRSAKIGLNVMSWYKAGMTERVSNLMLSGAVCLSDETKYLKGHMTDGEDIVLYRLDELEELPDIIRSILEDDEKRERISQKAIKKAGKEFGWHARGKELIGLAEQHLAIY